MTSGEDTQITGAKITAGNAVKITAQDKTTEQTNQKYAHAIPSHNKEFCSFTRHAKILTAGIHIVFRGLKKKFNTANGQTTKLCAEISPDNKAVCSVRKACEIFNRRLINNKSRIKVCYPTLFSIIFISSSVKS
ncbi:MAG: hypothetical protein JRJ49_09905 [Deltaproteobacteria bacterium]|nr:hypothetical protein [Deltaproteobacteria bacterium]